MFWRFPALVGGVSGLASLALPYSRVTGGVLGVDVQEETYTLLGLARLLEDTGNDPEMVYLLAGLVVLGSTVALVGAVVRSVVAAIGGLVQGVSATAFWYGATAEGSQTFLYGLGQMDMTLEVGFFVLVTASVVSLSSVVVALLVPGSA